MTADEVRQGAAAQPELVEEEVDAIVESYEDAQIKALKTAFLFAAFIVMASFWPTRRLPAEPLVAPA